LPAESPADYRPHHALLAQFGGLAAVIMLVLALQPLAQADLRGIPLLLAMFQGGVATMIAMRQGAPRWWLPIHLGFAPLLVLVHGLDIAPGWFLVAFMLLLLVFWRTDASRVPLYLSNRKTAEALLGLLPPTPCAVIDLGCGDGGLLARLARARPDCRFAGIEHAPLPWFNARLRCAGLPNVDVRRGDFWPVSLAGYDVVYAFLSPAPMPRLWEKARNEMAPGSLLVSNSFAVPGIEAEREVAVPDHRATRLLCYRPGR
jgi:SAM-dependent methyltransferase